MVTKPAARIQLGHLLAVAHSGFSLPEAFHRTFNSFLAKVAIAPFAQPRSSQSGCKLAPTAAVVKFYRWSFGLINHQGDRVGAER